MFKKSKKTINPNTTDTLVGEGTVFEGRIKSEASLRIEGNLIGDVECVGDVTIGENGDVKSNIHARNITIAGVVNGNVTTKGLLTITSTGQLIGNAASKSLLIAEGGILQGQSKMLQDTPKAEKEASAGPPVSPAASSASYNQTYSGSTAI